MWVSRTYSVAGDAVQLASRTFTVTGSTAAFGSLRLETSLTNVSTGEVIVLGQSATSTWGVAWSPDNERVAYYSDEGGEVGVWIWEKGTRKSWRFPGVIARPRHVTHLIHWLPDSRHLVCKLLPNGMTVGEANALGPRVNAQRSPRQFPPSVPNEVSTLVFRSPEVPQNPQLPAVEAGGEQSWLIGDLAVLDLATRSAKRIVVREMIMTYDVSTSGAAVAYSLPVPTESKSGEQRFDVRLYDLKSGITSVLLHEGSLVSMFWSWSPVTAQLAFFVPRDRNGGEINAADVLLIDSATGAKTILGGAGAPVYNVNEVTAPIWASDGRSLFATSQGKLWRISKSG